MKMSPRLISLTTDPCITSKFLSQTHPSNTLSMLNLALKILHLCLELKEKNQTVKSSLLLSLNSSIK